MHGASSDGTFKLDEPRGHGSAIPSSVFAFAELALEAPAAVTTAVQGKRALGPCSAAVQRLARKRQLLQRFRF